MTDNRTTALKLINEAVTELNENLDEQVNLDLGEEAPLYGKDGSLDSLSLVSLILLVEERVQDTFGRPVAIVDDRAMSQFRSPFRNVGTLADYVCTLVA